MRRYKVKFLFWFFDRRDMPGMSFTAVLKKKTDFVPVEGMTVFFGHWGLDFFLQVVGVHWDIKTGVFDVDLRDHEGALEFQTWDAMEAFFLEQGWEVVFHSKRPESED
jgi:hypothetical protein